MNRHTRQEVFERFRIASPHPTTELSFNSSFELFIAALLPAQAIDVGVNKATVKLFPVTATPQAMLDLGLDGVMEYTRTIGPYRTRSKRIMQTCHTLLEKYHGEVPADHSMLEVPPGVGCKTANVVLSMAFGQSVMAVDTHVSHVSNHIGAVPDKDVREMEDKLIRFVPKESLMNTCHQFILHGRCTRKVLKPQCEAYIISDLCEYPVRLMQSEERGRLKPGRSVAPGEISVCNSKF